MEGRYVKHGDIEEWVWDGQAEPAPEPEAVTTAAQPKPTTRKSPAKKSAARKTAAKKR